MPDLMPVVTHFGATVLLAPFSILIAIWLAARVGRREAVLWCLCVCGVGLSIALMKIYFSACNLRLHDIHSPSGHSAFSAIAYGGFTVIAMAGSHSVRAMLFRVGILLWVLLIGVSRVAVHAHTPGEVVVGLLVGTIGVLVFASLYGSRVRPPYVLAGGILVAVAAVAISLPAGVFTLEDWLRQVGRMLRPYEALLCMQVS